MADADVQITAGTGTKIDTRTVGGGTDEHRQVVVVGDPVTAANVGTVDSGGRQVVAPEIVNVVSTANSSTSVLAGGAAFTGTSEEVTNYAAVAVSVFASHASATDGLSLEQSSNGTNWDITDKYTIPATTGRSFIINPVARFFRVVYTNGATLQTSFRLQTIFKRGVPIQSSNRATDAQSNEFDLHMAQAFGMVWNGTTWDRLPGSAAAGVFVRPGTASTPSVNRIAAATSDTVLDAANSSRLGLILYNESTASCYVKYGSGASATSYTVFMGPGAYWEMPNQGPIYTGTVNGLWTAAAGNMQVTEITA